MGKRKKQHLSQAEIWDDSALIRSWDDALTEYKLYHSIHVRGERVEDVLEDMEAREESIALGAVATAGATGQDGDVYCEMLEDGELVEGEATSVPQDEQTETKDAITPSLNIHHHQQAPAANNGGYPQGAPGMPNAILGRVEDEALKNLMMSWYYAGYYTGLYEGQKQAVQTPAQGSSGEPREGN